MTDRSPAALRAAWMIARLGMLRWWNRFGGGLLKTGEEPGGGGVPRKATARKESSGWFSLLVGFFFLLFFFQALLGSHAILGGVSVELQIDIANARVPAHLIRISPLGYEKLLEAEAELEKLSREPENPARPRNERTREEKRKAILDDLERSLSWPHIHDFKLTDEEEAARAKEFVRVFQEKGSKGFHPWDDDWDSFPATFPAGGEDIMIRVIGTLLLFLALADLFTSLGSMNQDLGSVGWPLQWLYTFPVPARAIFIAKSMEYAIVGALGWILLVPFLIAALQARGLGLWAFPAGLILGAFLRILLGSTRVLAETWFRKTFSLARLKNLQALFTTLGLVFLLGALSVAYRAPDLLISAALPWAALWNPLSLPALLLDRGIVPWLAASGLVVTAMAGPWLATRASERLVRDGLLSETGPFQGRRTEPGAPGRRPVLPRGIVGKELRAVLRDRNRLVQTFVAPLIIVGFQLIWHAEFVRGGGGSFAHAAMLAFGVGAYVLLYSAAPIVLLEGEALWILYTLPRSLHWVFFRKTFLWGAFASSVTLAILCARALAGPAPGAGELLLFPFAVAGVAIHAFIASAIGILGTDPLATGTDKKLKDHATLLYFLAAALFAHAVYSPSAWNKVVQAVLSSILAIALWQKVAERIPYLLDPTDRPPRRLSLSDGILTVLALFGIQGILSILFLSAGVPAATTVFMATLAGGLVAGIGSLCALQGVPGFSEIVGLQAREGAFWRSSVLGFAGGCAAAILGLLYLKAAGTFEPLRQMQEELARARELMEDQQAIVGMGLMYLLVVPVEEYVFRGLVYGGMRRTMKVAPAILLSSALFAIVHPPLSAIPVFALGIIAAYSRERSGSLLAPILVHGIYNLVLLVAQSMEGAGSVLAP